MSDIQIADEVAAAFARESFTSWDGVRAFAEAKLKPRLGIDQSAAQLTTQLNAATIEGSGGFSLATQNYADLGLGSRFLASTGTPFPQAQGFLLSEAAMEPLTLPLRVVASLNGIIGGAFMLTSNPLDQGALKLEGTIAESAQQLRQIVPAVRIKHIWDMVPSNVMPVPPQARQRIDTLLRHSLVDPAAAAADRAKRHDMN